MKRFRICTLLMAAVLLGAVCAWATITLDSSEVRTYAVGGTNTETDSVASAKSETMDFSAQTYTIVVQYGSVGANGFTPGTDAAPLMVTVNAATGQVALSDGRPNLQLNATQMATLVSDLKAAHDTIEKRLLAVGILSGTQVAN